MLEVCDNEKEMNFFFDLVDKVCPKSVLVKFNRFSNNKKEKKLFYFNIFFSVFSERLGLFNMFEKEDSNTVKPFDELDLLMLSFVGSKLFKKNIIFLKRGEFWQEKITVLGQNINSYFWPSWFIFFEPDTGFWTVKKEFFFSFFHQRKLLEREKRKEEEERRLQQEINSYLSGEESGDGYF